MSAIDKSAQSLTFEAGGGTEDDDLPAVQHAGSAEIMEFFKKCGNKVKPVLVRAEMVMAAYSVEGAFEKMSDAFQVGVQHADGWLATFHGHAHTCDCGACGNKVECGPNNVEVRAFMCVFKHDLDPNTGGLVFPICTGCSAKADQELYIAVMENLGASRDDLVLPGKSPQEDTKEEIVINHLTQSSMKLYASYQEDHDFDTYLAGCVKAINEARDRYAELKLADQPRPDTPEGNHEVEAAHSKEDINLLVG